MNTRSIMIIVSIVFLLCLCFFVCPIVKRELNKTQKHSAYESLNTSLINELQSYYREKGRYPDSLDELINIEYSDGAAPEMLNDFQYISSGNNCRLSYYSSYFGKELVSKLWGEK